MKLANPQELLSQEVIWGRESCTCAVRRAYACSCVLMPTLSYLQTSAGVEGKCVCNAAFTSADQLTSELCTLSGRWALRRVTLRGVSDEQRGNEAEAARRAGDQWSQVSAEGVGCRGVKKGLRCVHLCALAPHKSLDGRT